MRSVAAPYEFFPCGARYGRQAFAVSAQGDKPPAITSAVDPDLGAVKKFITDMIAKGAIAALVAAIVALLTGCATSTRS